MSRFQHSMESDQHGTGPMFLAIEREVIGRAPDLDPFSSEEFNRFVGAARIITEQQNAWRTPWHPRLAAPRHLLTSPVVRLDSEEVWHVNPHGSHDGQNVSRAWIALNEYRRRGAFRTAFWVGFNTEQLARLQRLKITHPLRELTLVPPGRQSYRESSTMEISKQPKYASYLTCMSSCPDTRRRFIEVASRHGYVINGGSW